jgi:hypothetical protein
MKTHAYAQQHAIAEAPAITRKPVPSAADTGMLVINDPRIRDPLNERDPLQDLPAARSRMLELKDRCEELSATYREARDQLTAVNATRTDAERDLRRLETELRLTASRDPDAYVASHPNHIAAKSKFDKAAQEFARRQPRVESLSRQHQLASQLLRRCEDFLQDNRGKTFEAYTAPRRGKSDIATLEAVRERMDEIKEERDLTKSAPLPSDQAKALIDKWVDEIATSPDVNDTLWHGLPPRLPKSKSDIWEVKPTGTVVSAVDALSVVAFAMGDALKTALHDEMDRRARPEIAMTPQAKAAKLSQLDDDLLAVERREQELIGTSGIEQRPDVNPRAFLGLA